MDSLEPVRQVYWSENYQSGFKIIILLKIHAELLGGQLVAQKWSFYLFIDDFRMNIAW